VLAVWRFDLLQRYIPFLLYWGSRWPWPRFPATKIGVAAGSIMGITISGLCFDSQFECFSRTAWGSIFAAAAIVVIAAAIHDYRLYRKHQASDDGS
jgi:hypothetical protein